MKKLLAIILFFIAAQCSATKFEANTTYQVCFTPQKDCTSEIVSAINNAHKSILVQAFTFTSKPISQALIKAKKNGVDVKVIMDHNHVTDHGTSTPYLLKAGIDLKTDSVIETRFSASKNKAKNDYSCAHNKVMIIDDETVITGSFNFTKAAQFKNAENVLIINDKNLTAKYRTNWNTREKYSSIIGKS